jgi:hypothetical protein
MLDHSFSLEVFVYQIMISNFFPLSFSDTFFPTGTLEFEIQKDISYKKIVLVHFFL